MQKIIAYLSLISVNNRITVFLQSVIAYCNKYGTLINFDCYITMIPIPVVSMKKHFGARNFPELAFSPCDLMI